MVFENPNALWLILVVPLLLFGIGYFTWKTHKEIAEVFNLSLHRMKKKRIEKYLAVGGLLVWCVVGFAQPKLAFPSAALVQRTGEVLLLVDVSGSMAAQNTPDQMNRLERVKPMLIQIVDRMEQLEDVRLSLVGFTSIARSHVPFVGIEDYPYLRESIKNVLDIYSTPGHGTSLGQPVLNVLDKFSQEAQAKLIVLFSDGEIFIGSEPGMQAVERAWLDEAISKATKNGVKVITVGVGELEGAKVPIDNSQGNEIGDYVQLEGTDYLSYLNEDSLIELASRTGGQYFPEQSQDDLLAYIEQNLSSAPSAAIPEESVDYRSITPWLILAAVPLWIFVAKRYFL